MRSEQEKFELIFEHLSGHVSGGEELARLLQEDERSRAVYEGLVRTFSHLDNIGEAQVPAGLGDRALSYIEVYSHARGAGQLENSRVVILDHKDFVRESRASWILGNLRDLIAVAACLAMVVLVGKPGLDYSRELSRQKQCQSQMAEIGSSFASYASDHAGQMPRAEGVAGSEKGKWWHIGETDPDAGSSNTRHIYRLVRDGYIRPERFICPSGISSQEVYAQVKAMSDQIAREQRDFLSRDHLNYSFKLMVDNISNWGVQREAVAADKNPIFADFDSKLQSVVSVPDGSKLRTVNSRNHNNGGQMVLFSDGSVIFMKNRLVGPQSDDIFTIKKRVEYFGTEKPEAGDIFIAP